MKIWIIITNCNPDVQVNNSFHVLERNLKSKWQSKYQIETSVKNTVHQLKWNFESKRRIACQILSKQEN